MSAGNKKPEGDATKRVESYLAGIPVEMRAALEQLRKVIRAAAPGAEETVSYGVPMFKLHGPLVSFGAASKHCAFYVQSPEVMKAHQAELKTYDTSKGTIRFQPNKPLPVALVRKLVKARIAENEARAKKKSK